MHPAGLVRVAAIVDTSGRVEPHSVEGLSTPDSLLYEPVRQMLLESQFSPGRLKGVTVRVMKHVEPGSAKIVQSPNHAVDQEALRVVRGAAYRPAKSGGQSVRAVIRQAISFVNY